MYAYTLHINTVYKYVYEFHKLLSIKLYVAILEEKRLTPEVVAWNVNMCEKIIDAQDI